MKFDFSHVDLSAGPSQIKDAFSILLSTPDFILKHELWKGFLEHKWVLILSVVIASLFSYTLCKDIYHYFIPPPIEIEIPPADLEDVTAEEKVNIEAAKETISEAKEKHKPLFSGSLKFLLLIFLEVFIFHFAVKTNNILKGESKILVFKDFVKAQKRMILVMGRKWILGLIMYVIVSILCAISGWSAMRDSIMFLVYGFYLGFAFIDNYLEQFGFNIKQSVKCIQKNFGASAFFGVLTSITMNIPLLGPLIVPIVFGIAATRYGHARKIESFKVEK